MTTVEDIVKEACEKLKNPKLEKYHAESEKRKDKMMTLLKEVAAKEVQWAQKLSKFNKTNLPGMEKEIENIIGRERVKLMKNSLKAETFKITNKIQPDGSMHVQIFKDGKQFKAEIVIKKGASGSDVSALQALSITVEVFLIGLNAAGIDVTLDEGTMRRIEEELLPIFETSAFKRAIDELMKAWNQEGATILDRAAAIFTFLHESFTGDFFWTVVDAVLSDMDAFDYAKSILEVTVILVAAFATDGLALIARIVLALNDAYTLSKKFLNLKELDVRERSLVSTT